MRPPPTYRKPCNCRDKDIAAIAQASADAEHARIQRDRRVPVDPRPPFDPRTPTVSVTHG